ncbi:MAG: hypothetical protein GW855_06175 [Erythrobacter sp.]|nr:hypothetical protein [Erythrobacter sp.]NCQ63404.1 hypothetical protein [Alphaproteobacteria bacterium]
MVKYLRIGAAVSVSLGLATPLVAQQHDPLALQQDAECLLVFTALLGELEGSENPDYETVTGAYSIVGYFVGKMTARDGQARLESALTEDLAERVDTDYERIEARCTAEAAAMGNSITVMFGALEAD